jgi:hypothetical protein
MHFNKLLQQLRVECALRRKIGHRPRFRAVCGLSCFALDIPDRYCKLRWVGVYELPSSLDTAFAKQETNAVGYLAYSIFFEIGGTSPCRRRQATEHFVCREYRMRPAANASVTDQSILFYFERIFGCPGAKLTSCKSMSANSLGGTTQLA